MLKKEKRGLVKLAEEKRDKLERLIEMQKKKVKPAGVKPKREEPKTPEAPITPTPQPAMPAQPTGAPPGISGMQPSIMEGGAPAAMPAPAQPQAMPQMPAQMPQQPAMPAPAPTRPEAPEPEEIATLPEPQLPVAQLAYNRTNIEEIESLIESVVEEKWRQAMESFQDFNLWKEKARTEIISVKQELLRLEQRFENMEKAMIGKVHEYDTHVLDIGAEIKALEKVLQKIMQPLVRNIKDLDQITKKLKK